MKSKIERERKWLLKGIPGIPSGVKNSILYIDQYYDDTNRYRSETSEGGTRTFYKMKKTPISMGVFNDEVEEITSGQYYDAIKECTSALSKVRTTFSYLGKEFMIDYFDDDFNLVVLEIEETDAEAFLKEDPKIPEWLAPWIIMEVTQFPEFSNKSLSNPVR